MRHLLQQIQRGSSQQRRHVTCAAAAASAEAARSAAILASVDGMRSKMGAGMAPNACGSFSGFLACVMKHRGSGAGSTQQHAGISDNKTSEEHIVGSASTGLTVAADL